MNKLLYKLSATAIAALSVTTAFAQSGNFGIGTPTPGSKLTVNGSFAATYNNVSANYTMTAADYYLAYSGAGGTVTLPVTPASPDIKGRVYHIKNTGAGTLTVAANGSETIDNQSGPAVASFTIPAGSYTMLISKGTGAATTWEVSFSGTATAAPAASTYYDWLKVSPAGGLPTAPGDNSADIYHLGGKVGIGTASPIVAFMTQAQGVNSVSNVADDYWFRSYGTAPNPHMILQSFGGTPAAPVALTNGADLGQYLFNGYTNNASQCLLGIGATYKGASATDNSADMWFNYSPTTGGSLEGMRLTSTGNVGIGTATPTESALLHLNSGSKGFLAPQVALTATNTAGPITLPATALMVYNTATAGAGATAVTPGYYYNSGNGVAPLWVKFTASASGVVPDINIYNSDGTLTGVRTVTMGGNVLNFSGGNVGINQAAPLGRLSNSAVNPVGTDNLGVNAESFNWAHNAIGYTGAFYNANAAGASNGLAVKVASATANTNALDVSQGATAAAVGASLLSVKGDGKVGIGTSAPDGSALLHLNSANKGFLAPQVALTATNAAGPITLPATALMVYNTATAGAGATAVTPGYYYNSGTGAAPLWVKFTASASGTPLNIYNSDGTLTGARTVTMGTNILNFSGGNVGINQAAPYARFGNTSANTNGTDGFGVNTESFSWQQNAPGFTGAFWNASASAQSHGLEVKVASPLHNSLALDVSQNAAQGSAGTPLLTVTGDGQTGIGTNNPTQALDVNGKARIRNTPQVSPFYSFTNTTLLPLYNDGTGVVSLQPQGFTNLGTPGLITYKNFAAPGANVFTPIFNPSSSFYGVYEITVYIPFTSFQSGMAKFLVSGNGTTGGIDVRYQGGTSDPNAAGAGSSNTAITTTVSTTTAAGFNSNADIAVTFPGSFTLTARIGVIGTNMGMQVRYTGGSANAVVVKTEQLF